jgi:hypothetical protein
MNLYGFSAYLLLKLQLNLRIYFWVYFNIELFRNIQFIRLFHIRAPKLCCRYVYVDVIRNSYARWLYVLCVVLVSF